MVRGILKISQINKIIITKHPVTAFFLTLLLFISSIKADSYAVASRHHLATDIGMKVLEEAREYKKKNNTLNKKHVRYLWN